MQIQINTDKTLNGHHRQQDYFTSEIAEGLKRYESHITRVEVHLKDENGRKDGFNDMTCALEARIEGRQPIAVTSKAGTVELAVSGAIDKANAAIKTIIGKVQNH